MISLRDLPIRRKLTIVIVGTFTIACVLAAVALTVFELLDGRRMMIRASTVKADVIGHNVQAALAFSDPEAAQQTLLALTSDPEVVAAGVYDAEGNRFAEYRREGHETPAPARAPPDASTFDRNGLALSRPITLKERRIGTIHLRVSLDRLREHLGVLGAVGLFGLLGSILVAIAVSPRMQRPISEPLLALTRTSRAVTEGGDFSGRAAKLGNDEIGVLTDAFNRMLDVIEERERALRAEIEERQRAEARVAEMNETLEWRVEERTAQLERANQELESFSYSVSHDLRAPLRAVDGYARLLEEDYIQVLDANGRRLLSVVRDEARRMGALIDDLLGFSRLGRQPLRPGPIDLAAMSEEIIRDVRHAHPDRAIELEYESLPPALADASTIRQVLVNLLSNAAKYAKPDGPIRIELGGRSDGDQNMYWVRDQGVGFDMRYVNKIFGVFQRLHGDEFEGTGVGLAIVERIVARHGGTVRAEGAIDEGACFSFTLPAAETGSAALQPQEEGSFT
jgi:signal transduction histidine kinase